MELNELLNKVSEEDLAKAVGGLTQRNKNLLIGAVALLAGTAALVGGKFVYDKWGTKKSVGDSSTPAAPESDAPESAEDLKKSLLERLNKKVAIKKLIPDFQKWYALENSGKTYKGSDTDIRTIIESWN